jgi:hypothetical protein
MPLFRFDIRVNPRALRTSFAALLPLAVASCGGPQSNLPQFAPPCPSPALIGTAADLTRYRGTGRDLTDMVLDGRITGVHGGCKLDDKPNLLDVTVQVDLELTRGPAAPGRTAQIAYFIAVSEGEQILNKRIIPVQATFPANVDRVHITADPIGLVLPISDTKSGAAYTIDVGFQLAPEELQLNRERGPR